MDTPTPGTQYTGNIIRHIPRGREFLRVPEIYSGNRHPKLIKAERAVAALDELLDRMHEEDKATMQALKEDLEGEQYNHTFGLEHDEEFLEEIAGRAGELALRAEEHVHESMRGMLPFLKPLEHYLAEVLAHRETAPAIRNIAAIFLQNVQQLRKNGETTGLDANNVMTEANIFLLRDDIPIHISQTDLLPPVDETGERHHDSDAALDKELRQDIPENSDWRQSLRPDEGRNTSSSPHAVAPEDLLAAAATELEAAAAQARRSEQLRTDVYAPLEERLGAIRASRGYDHQSPTDPVMAAASALGKLDEIINNGHFRRVDAQAAAVAKQLTALETTSTPESDARTLAQQFINLYEQASPLLADYPEEHRRSYEAWMDVAKQVLDGNLTCDATTRNGMRVANTFLENFIQAQREEAEAAMEDLQAPESELDTHLVRSAEEIIQLYTQVQYIIPEGEVRNRYAAWFDFADRIVQRSIPLTNIPPATRHDLETVIHNLKQIVVQHEDEAFRRQNSDRQGAMIELQRAENYRRANVPTRVRPAFERHAESAQQLQNMADRAKTTTVRRAAERQALGQVYQAEAQLRPTMSKVAVMQRKKITDDTKHYIEWFDGPARRALSNDRKAGDLRAYLEERFGVHIDAESNKAEGRRTTKRVAELRTNADFMTLYRTLTTLQPEKVQAQPKSGLLRGIINFFR